MWNTLLNILQPGGRKIVQYIAHFIQAEWEHEFLHCKHSPITKHVFVCIYYSEQSKSAVGNTTKNVCFLKPMVELTILNVCKMVDKGVLSRRQVVGDGCFCSSINPQQKLFLHFLSVDLTSRSGDCNYQESTHIFVALISICFAQKLNTSSPSRATFTKFRTKAWRKTSTTGFAKSLQTGHNVLVAASMLTAKREQWRCNAASNKEGTAEVTVESSRHLERMRVFLETNKVKC